MLLIIFSDKSFKNVVWLAVVRFRFGSRALLLFAKLAQLEAMTESFFKSTFSLNWPKGLGLPV